MDEKLIGKYSCAQKNCPIKSTGVCLEAVPQVEKCPHIKILSTLSIDVAQSSGDFPNGQESEEPMFNGDEIYEDKLHHITNWYNVKLILLMGDSEAGKTTLLASLFDKFQKGSCAEYIFSGSRTQIGFEKRCFLARWSGSGRLIPDTERTKSLIMHYLHLAIRNQKRTKPIEHLIFSDVSGEQFRLIRDFETEMLKFNVIKRADCIFYLVNGESLISADRHRVKSNMIKLIQRAIECNMLDLRNPMNIVITKYDKIHGELDSINSFFVSDLKSKFPDHVKSFLYVASRSETASIGAGTGLDELLGKVMIEQSPVSETINDIESSREFQRFKIFV